MSNKRKLESAWLDAPDDSTWLYTGEELPDGSRIYRNSVTGQLIGLRLTDKGRKQLLKGRSTQGT